MTWILVFVFLYMAISALDVLFVNRLFERIENPAAGKEVPPLPPAPRLVINLPPKKEQPPAA